MAHTVRKGVKRKHEERDDVHRHWQRQSIIDMSMGKLRTNSFQRREPCLRRSVLILNTLKEIESELKQEGVDTHQSMEAARNEIPEMSMAQLTLDPLPDMSTFIYPLPSSSLVPMSVDSSSGEDGDPLVQSSSVVDLLPAKPLVVQDSSVVDLLPAKPLMGCQDQALSQTSSSVYYCTPSQVSTVPPSPSLYFGASPLDSGVVTHPSSMYYGVPSLDTPSSAEYFLTSLLEPPKVNENGDSNNNFAAQGPYSAGTSSNSLIQCLASFPLPDVPLSEAEVLEAAEPPLLQSSSVSVNIEELVHSLQEAIDTVAARTPPPTPPPAPTPAPVLNVQCSSCSRTDSTLDDLDSIMQILVGTWKADWKTLYICVCEWCVHVLAKNQMDHWDVRLVVVIYLAVNVRCTSS